MTRGIRKPAKPDLLVSFTCLTGPCLPASPPHPSMLCLPSRLALNAAQGPSSSSSPLPPVHARMPLDICVVLVPATDENRTTTRVSRIAFAIDCPRLSVSTGRYLFFSSLDGFQRRRGRVGWGLSHFRVKEDGLVVRWILDDVMIVNGRSVDTGELGGFYGACK